MNEGKVEFSQPAAGAVYAAEKLALGRGERVLNSRHLMIGVLQSEDSAISKIVDSFALDRDPVVSAMRTELPEAKTALEGDAKLGDDAKFAIDRAYEEVRALGSGSLGTEHLLLGITREREDAASQMLSRIGIDYDKLRQIIE